MSHVLNFNDICVYDSINDSVLAHSQFPIPFPLAVQRIARSGIIDQLVQRYLESSPEFGGNLLDIA